MKTCTRCKLEKSLDNFNKEKKGKYGVKSRCKRCANFLAMEIMKTSKKCIATRKAYRKSPEYKQRHAERMRLNRGKYRYKDRARQAVSAALRKKKLIKEPCEICGEVKVEAHHDDYNNRLAVRWLCVKHHKELHLFLKRKEAA